MKLQWYRMMLFLVVLLQGCVEAPKPKGESLFVVMKTPAMRYADQGFLYQTPDEVNVEIYNSGQALLRLQIGKSRICTGQFSCLERETFNRRMLAAVYPENTLEKIFRSEPLFDGRKIIKKRNGFTQKLFKPGKYDIVYRVLMNETVFRDTINHIMIKIKRLK